MEENFNPVMQDIKEKNKVYTKTFLWMFLGLLATGIISVFTYFSGFTKNFIDIWGVLLVVELVVVILFSFLSRKLPPSVVGVLFFVYAIINGITLSTIFAVFELSSIIIIFFASSVIFGLCALLGNSTKIDLSKIGSIFLITLIVGALVSIINLFLKSSLIDIVIDWVILFVFFGITAWDMQKIKLYAKSDRGNIDSEDKIAIYFAMDLYLDFINIFLRLLNIFGSRKD